MLNIKNLHVKLEEEDKQILKGVNSVVGVGQSTCDYGTKWLRQIHPVLCAVR